jgi:Domain of unknown function (DUF4349)
MGNRRRMGGAVLGLLAASALAGGLAGCSGSSSSSGTSAPRAALATSGTPGAAATLGGLHRAAGNLVGVADIAPATLPARVIQTADVQLQVGHGRVGGTVAGIRRLAVQAGGYLSRSSVSGTGTRTGSVVVRIPQARFSAVLTRIEGMGRLTSETEAGQDVTAQFIDLSARLTNVRDQENFLRRLMARAGTVNGSIEIESRLTQVQLAVEQITGQLRYLRNRTDFSTITVRVAQTGAAPPAHHHASSLWKAGARSLHGGLTVVSAVIVGAGYTIPVALLALAGLGAARLARPRLARAAPAPGPTPEA